MSSINAILQQYISRLEASRHNSEATLKKILREGQLKLHPNKLPKDTSTQQKASAAFQKLTTAYNRIIKGDVSNGNNSNNNDRRRNKNYNPRAWRNAGRKYRQYDFREVPSHIFKDYRTAPDASDNIKYNRLKKVNPVALQKKVLDKLPLKFRPCTPGYTRKKSSKRCALNRRAKFKKERKMYGPEFDRFGVPAGYVATTWGRKTAANSIVRSRNEKLIDLAKMLGFNPYHPLL